MKKLLLIVLASIFLQLSCCSDPEENIFVVFDETNIENNLDTIQEIHIFEKN